MQVTIGGIPVYDAVISDEDCGMFRISLVDDPAVMSNFLAFDSHKKPLMYAIQDEEKRLVRGVVMRADFPIYRRDGNDFEYYVIYKADEIRKMAEKYLVESRQNDVNLMHEEGSDVEGVQMVQYFLKDSEGGVNPAGFEDIADGSLFAEFHVVNDDVWAAIKDGTYKGFSLEGVFDLVPEKDKGKVETIVDTLDGAFSRLFKNYKNMSKLNKFKEALKKMLQEFGNITTDKGVLAWDGEEDLKEGDLAYIEDQDGNRIAAEAGDYTTEDGKVIVIADGKVSEIKEVEVKTTPEGEEQQMSAISTDKGDLSWEGDGEIAVGAEVFVEKDGEKVAAEDGDYVAEDGRTIVVAEGKVSEIKEAEAGAEAETVEVNAMRLRHSKVAQTYSESYDEKYKKLAAAVTAVLGEESWPWVVEAGDDYVVAEVWDEDGEKMYRFPVTWGEDGLPVLGEKEEVKYQIVPVDAASPWEGTTEEEFNALTAERDSLKAEVEQLRKQPLAKPAHEEVVTSMKFQATGVKGLDRLASKLGYK